MINSEILQSVIKKYEMNETFPIDARKSMLKYRHRNLIAILKKDSVLPIYISATVSFFLWVKKFGIPVSIAKSAAAVAAALIITAGTMTTGAIYSAYKIVNILNVKSDAGKNSISEQLVQNSTEENKEIQQVIRYSIAVQPVQTDDSLKPGDYTGTVIKEIQSIKGAKGAIGFNRLDKYHTSEKLLKISIIKLKEKSLFESKSYFRISAKIINSSNSHLITHVSETAKDKKDIDKAIKGIVSKISAKL